MSNKQIFQLNAPSTSISKIILCVNRNEKDPLDPFPFMLKNTRVYECRN